MHDAWGKWDRKWRHALHFPPQIARDIWHAIAFAIVPTPSVTRISPLGRSSYERCDAGEGTRSAAVFAADNTAADEQPGREPPPVRKGLWPHGRPEESLTPRLPACIVITSAP
jgi:hypothetical protein